MYEQSKRGLIIGVTGLAGSGKTTVADLLVEKHGFMKIALADPMKRFCQEIFQFSDEQLWGTDTDKAEPDERYRRPGGVVHRRYLTSRFALQTLGTEWGRGCYEDVWVDYCLRATESILRGQNYSAKLGLLPTEYGPYSCPAGVVIHDVRFHNEFDAIKNAGGFIVHVRRPGAGLSGDAAEHLSETEQKEFEGYDFVIDNLGTMQDLEEKISQVLSCIC
jgi:hypothetical protein